MGRIKGNGQGMRGWKATGTSDIEGAGYLLLPGLKRKRREPL